MPAAACMSVPANPKNPLDNALLPPVSGCFSSNNTCAPASAASSAAQ
jgi:hypothetical protein